MYREDKTLVLFYLPVSSHFKYKKGTARMLYGTYDAIKLRIVIQLKTIVNVTEVASNCLNSFKVH